MNCVGIVPSRWYVPPLFYSFGEEVAVSSPLSVSPSCLFHMFGNYVRAISPSRSKSPPSSPVSDRSPFSFMFLIGMFPCSIGILSLPPGNNAFCCEFPPSLSSDYPSSLLFSCLMRLEMPLIQSDLHPPPFPFDLRSLRAFPFSFSYCLSLARRPFRWLLLMTFFLAPFFSGATNPRDLGISQGEDFSFFLGVDRFFFFTRFFFLTRARRNLSSFSFVSSLLQETPPSLAACQFSFLQFAH